MKTDEVEMGDTGEESQVQIPEHAPSVKTSTDPVDPEKPAEPAEETFEQKKQRISKQLHGQYANQWYQEGDKNNPTRYPVKP